MKTALFVFAGWIFRLFLNIFGKEKKETQPQSSQDEPKTVEVPQRPIYRPKPKHNCRKSTPGRIIQEIKLGRSSRFIVHAY